MLKGVIIGNLGGDAVVREVGSQKVISFNVAHNDRYTDRQSGQQIERTQWISCSYWRDPNRIRVADYLKKGTQVYVEGNLQLREYTRQDGTPGTSLDCRVNYLELLSGGARSGDAEGGYNQNPGNYSGGDSSAGGQGGGQTSQQPANQPAPNPPGYSSEGETPEDDLPF